eukprot:INCI9867.3.p1 GENE.INCI9867.3~~INCI9867.3.p1  ORF type:complete len:132 (-),score=22.94 INCI9867.3:17-412(-)
MNALGGKKFASTMAFTSYDHFLDLLETHVVLGDSIDQKILPSEEEGVGFRKWRPAYQYTATTETVQTPLLGATLSNTPPTVKVLFDTAPLVATLNRFDVPLRQYVTSTCAIIGGAFTVLKVLAEILRALRP